MNAFVRPAVSPAACADATPRLRLLERRPMRRPMWRDVPPAAGPGPRWWQRLRAWWGGGSAPGRP